MSARSFAGTGGATLIDGFVIGGSTPKTVLIRASGPALANFSLSGFLQDHYLRLFDGANNLVAANYGYKSGNPLIPAIASEVGAFAWSSTCNDSAIVATLPPGAYAAEVSSGTGATGTALIEAYEVP